jgi:hypothetical protein
MLTFVVTTTPATGVLAAITDPAVPAGPVLPAIETDPTPTTTPEPLPVPEVTPEPTPIVEPTPSPEPTLALESTPAAEPTPAPTAEPTPEVSTAAVVPPTQPSRPRVVPAAKRPARLWTQLRRGLTVRGRASWYYATRGYASVAHIAMPGARYLPRGRDGVPRARVCAAGRCVVVRVVDFCGCYARTPRARVADLSLGTLRRLRLDPGRGVYKVRVTLIRP